MPIQRLRNVFWFFIGFSVVLSLAPLITVFPIPKEPVGRPNICSGQTVKIYGVSSWSETFSMVLYVDGKCQELSRLHCAFIIRLNPDKTLDYGCDNQLKFWYVEEE